VSEIDMRNEEFQIYETWDLKMPEVSPRAILYNLPPVGVETADAESLTGYISRLAQEHYLSPLVLLKNCVWEIPKLPKLLLQDSISSVFARSLNGFGENAAAIVEILQNATFRDDILYTTLLPWKGKLSNQKLLKKQMAWCPVCYEEQREEGIVYDKLIWTLEKIKACHVHELPLLDSCPHCSKKLKVLSGKSRPGYCSRCLRWLGSNLISFDDLRGFRNDKDKKIEVWRAVKAGEFLAKSSPFFMPENQPVFIENLNALIQTFAGGNINDFAHKTRMWHMSIRRLLKGEVLPTLEMLFNICFPLNISPIELFQQNTEFKAEETGSLNNGNKPSSKDEMKICLNNLLLENPPPSANEVSRRTGWRIARWQRNFPEEYKAIVQRYTRHVKEKLPQLTDEEIEKILLQATKENPSPSLQSVLRRIGCRNTGYRYYRRFPKLCEEISKRYKKLNDKTFDIKKARKIMKSALEENPPPSFSEIARRIKCNRETLDKKLPELSKSLHERYKNYLGENRKNNHRELYNAIKNAIIKLQMKQSSVTENSVRKHLPRKWNDIAFKDTYRKVKQDLEITTDS
jgi:transcriptional regulator with XRE-family HTH domain